MSKNKKISQKEFIFQYYKNNPHRDIEHQEIVPAVTQAWKNQYGKTLADPDRAIRTLFEEAGLAHLIFKMLIGQMFQLLLSFVSKK